MPYILPYLAILITICLVYGQSLSFSFVYDDFLHIVGNPKLRELSAALSSFAEPLSPGNLFRPLLIISYALNGSLSFNPSSFHLVNVALHAVNMCMLYAVLSSLCSRRAAAAIAVLVSVHPAISEAVANVSGRSELLVHFFGLAALLTIMNVMQETPQMRSRSRPVLLFTLFLAALLSKENALSYPLIACLIFGYRGIAPWTKEIAARVWIPMGLAAIIYAALRFFAFRGVDPDTIGVPFIDNPLVALNSLERAFNACYLLTRYIVLLLLPVRLSADYSFRQFIPLSLPPGFEGALFAAVPLLLLWVDIRRFAARDAVGFFILWFFAAFAITSNVLFPIGTVFAERLLYLPSIGIVGAIAVLTARICHSTASYAVLASVLFALAWRTHSHIPVWRDNYTLWHHQLTAAPYSIKLPANYAAALIDKGRYDEALLYIDEAERRDPNNKLYRLRGIAYGGLGRDSDAVAAFEKGLEVSPQDARTIEAYRRFKKEH